MTRLWRRLANRMTGHATTERLAALERLVRKIADARGEQAAALQAHLASISETLARQPTAKDLRDLREVRESVRGLAERIARQEDPLFAAGRIHLLKSLEKIATNEGPILIGPWTGEVGYELLYWIPFVRWARAQFGLAPRRELVVSRGGVASWYGVPPEQYADVFGVIGADEFRRATAAQPTLKQQNVAALDRRIIEAVRQQRGLGHVDVLHPGMMFRAFRQYWEDDAGYGRIDALTKYALLAPPAAEPVSGLPSEYAAVRFYFRRSFPDTRENRAFVHTVVTALAERIPVVLLTSGVRVDDHEDWLGTTCNRVTVAAVSGAERNLAVQSAIISRARAFVGTYGGFSYLAPLYGVPSIAFHSRNAFDANHLHAARRAFERIGAAPLTTVDVSQVALVQSALGTVIGAHR